MRLEAARLAAYLLPAVFSCDVVHPQRELEFALYTPVELWPGKDLFTDAYRWAWQNRSSSGKAAQWFKSGILATPVAVVVRCRVMFHMEITMSPHITLLDRTSAAACHFQDHSTNEHALFCVYWSALEDMQ